MTGTLTEQQIRLQGRLQTPQDFLQLVVANRGGQLVRLGPGRRREGHVGRGAVIGAAQRAPGGRARHHQIEGREHDPRRGSDQSQSRPTLQRTLPAGVHLSVVKDAGIRVHNSVRNVEEALIEGALLTVLVVFLFLNSWRSTIITGLALPVSTIAAFIAVWAFGFTLNTMSLLGLSLAIGILIDDAIVVRENIVRHIELGEDHVTASHRGTDEIGLAVTATTFSIVAVFAPVAFMSGTAGQWFKPFALTIACAVLVSLFVSFSLDPMLSAYWPDPQLEAHQQRNVVAPNAGALQQVVRPSGRSLQDASIAWALDHRYTMVGLAGLSFAGAIVLQATVGGGGFVPDSDRSEFDIQLKTPPGSNLDYMRIKLEEVGRMVRNAPRGCTTPMRRSAISPGPAGSTTRTCTSSSPRGRSVVSSRRRSRSSYADEIAPRRRRHRPYVFSNGFGDTRKQIEMQLRGNDAATLARVRRDVLPQSCGPCRALSTLDCRPPVSDRSCRSTSTAGWRAPSASPWAKWRSRCARRSPDCTPGTGSIRPARHVMSPSA